MRLTNLRLCPAGNSRCFYIPKTYMSDNQIGDYFDLVITPHAEPIKHQPSIRSQVLDLLSNHEPWSIPDLAAQSCQHVNQPAHVIYEFIEAILDTVPEITKVGDARYRLLIA